MTVLDEDDVGAIVDRDFEDGVDTVRGLVIGTAIAVVPWLMLAAGIYALVAT